MRIGFDFVQPSASPGGCGRYARSLLETMAQLAPSHEFLAFRHFGQWFLAPDQLTTIPQSQNVRDPLDSHNVEASIKEWQSALQSGTAPGHPDLVHSTSFQAPRLSKAKLVVTVFDLSFWVMPECTTDNIRLGCQDGILDTLDNADGLIFISEHARAEFDRLLPLHRRRGMIPSIVTPLAPQWRPLSSDRLCSGSYWLFVGSLEPRKNLLNLLRAYQDYAQGHASPLPLWLAGGPGWENDAILAKLEPLERIGQVRRLGNVPDDDLRCLYQEARALIFPSWYEGFGLPIIEAMSQGCPVISSDRSCLRETAGAAALYIDPAQPAEITCAMRQLESDPDLRDNLVRAGLSHARGFDWTATAKQTLAFYERILSTA